MIPPRSTWMSPCVAGKLGSNSGIGAAAGGGAAGARSSANAANGARQVVASAMALNAWRVVMSTSLLEPFHHRKKKAPLGLFDPCTCEWQLMQVLWFASAELNRVLPGPRNGIE